MRLRKALCLLPLLAVACSPTTTTGTSTPSTPTSTVDESAAVAEAFKTYKSAALNKDGATAVAAIAKPVFEFYDETRKKALSAPESEVAGLPIGQRMSVYVMRAETAPATLRDSSAQDLVKDSIDKGLVGEQGLSNLELGKVTVTGGSATGEVISKGQTAPFKLMFLREDGKWKLDIEPLLDMANNAFIEAAKQQGMTPDQLVNQLMEAKYGPAKYAELRQPINR